MLFETLRTCLYKPCPDCGNKLFRYLLKGTFQSDDYGLTHGLQVWDRCEVCHQIFGQTEVALHTAKLEEQVELLFDYWDKRGLSDAEFIELIQIAFCAVGGWVISPDQKTG